jgi:hypothetical protein
MMQELDAEGRGGLFNGLYYGLTTASHHHKPQMNAI